MKKNVHVEYRLKIKYLPLCLFRTTNKVYQSFDLSAQNVMHTNKRTSSRGSERRKTRKVLRSPFATFLFLKDGIEEQYCREQSFFPVSDWHIKKIK